MATNYESIRSSMVDYSTMWGGLHVNKSQMALWTMQFRFFNFNNPDGQKINWSGAFASGVDFEDIHPEFVTTK